MTVTLFVRHDRERLDTRLALYLAGTAASKDWVMRAAAYSGCLSNFALTGLLDFSDCQTLLIPRSVAGCCPVLCSNIMKYTLIK